MNSNPTRFEETWMNNSLVVATIGKTVSLPCRVFMKQVFQFLRIVLIFANTIFYLILAQMTKFSECHSLLVSSEEVNDGPADSETKQNTNEIPMKYQYQYQYQYQHQYQCNSSFSFDLEFFVARWATNNNNNARWATQPSLETRG